MAPSTHRLTSVCFWLLLGSPVVVMACDANFCLHRSTGLHADPQDCQAVYLCHDARTRHYRCQPGRLFNPKLNYCDWPEEVQCPSGSSKSNATSQPTTNAPATSSESSSYSTTSGTTKGQNTKPAPKPLNTTECPRIVCYFVNDFQYRKGPGNFEAKDVDPHLCTHIVYGFAHLNGNQLKSMKGNDETSYQIITNHKKANPQVKVLLSVGGWDMGSLAFTAMVATRESRQEFIDTSIKFVRDRNFDGLDLCWRYPTERGSPTEDKQRFLLLCQELRDAFEAEGRNTGTSRLLLTAAVSAIKHVIDKAYDIRTLSAALDFISILSFSYHGGRHSVTRHPTPLYPHPLDRDRYKHYNVNATVGFWLNGGADRDKLVVGLSLRPRSLTLANASDNGVGAPASGYGLPGPYTKASGFLSYYEVCTARNSGGIRHFIEEQRVPYLVAGNQWIGYEDQASLREKVRYIRDMNLGGAMVYFISKDDISGSFCNEGKNPLIHAIVDECKIIRIHNP